MLRLSKHFPDWGSIRAGAGRRINGVGVGDGTAVVGEGVGDIVTMADGPGVGAMVDVGGTSVVGVEVGLGTGVGVGVSALAKPKATSTRVGLPLNLTSVGVVGI